MFVLKSLGRLILGNQDQVDLLQLPAGTLYSVTVDAAGRPVRSKPQVPSSPPPRPHLFPGGGGGADGGNRFDAGDEPVSMTLRRGDQKYSYRLVLATLDSSKHPDQLVFVVDPALSFTRTLDASGHTCFEWNDTRPRDPAVRPPATASYEFVVDKSTSTTTIEMFQVTMAQCLFEARENRSHAGATDSDFTSLIITRPAPPVDGSASPDDRPQDESNEDDDDPIFTSDPAGFYIFDSALNAFTCRHPNVTAVVGRKRPATTTTTATATGGPTFFLKVFSNDPDRHLLHRQQIDPDATQHTDRATASFIWCHFSASGDVWTFSLRFSSAISLMGLANVYVPAVYEVLNDEKLARLAKDDARYVQSPFLEDVEMQPVAPTSGDPDHHGRSSDSDSDQASATASDSEADDGDRDTDENSGDRVSANRPAGSSDAANRQLAIGCKNDRSFVSRGHAIGVFKHTDDERLEFRGNIDRVQSLQGKPFAPSKMLLHEEDTAMILMNPDDRHKLYRMDLEYGRVVDEWTVHPDAPVTNIVPDSKYAQMTPNQTLIGMNTNSIFRIDPRLGGNKRVDTEMKQYVVKNEFSCGATTGQGELAVASAKGEIRLFNKLDKRAKTLLPMFGDPITGIDTTESGKLIVATCKTYLLLISTEITGDPAGTLGFTKSMGTDRPVPKRLQLKPEHVAFMGAPVSFTPARFSTGAGEERSIITSTGPYVIIWNVRRVKQGKLYDYQIKKYADKVVADNFRFGQDRSIVVTLPHQVTMISKKSLSTPSPKVFRMSPPAPPRSSRLCGSKDNSSSSGVVDSPY